MSRTATTLAAALFTSTMLAACGGAGSADDSAAAVNEAVNGAEANAAAPSGKATAALANAAGAASGTATLEAVGTNLKLTVNAEGVAPGTHGIHVHMTGKCDAPDFASAGAHWNPSSRQHGLENPQGSHAGDLPNIVIGADGKGTITAELLNTAVSGEAGLIDADGAAIVIHADPDDMKSDPSGNSGGRIACGVFKAD